MADAVGLVASVITLGEVATKVIALKKLWEKVQDVPRSIQIQVDQIEALNSVMEEVEAQAKRNAVLGVRTGVLSMRYCKQAATELDEAIRELQQRIESKSHVRRTFAKIKVVLEQDSILRAQNRLQGALQMMQLALTLHACSLAESAPERTASIFFSRQAESNARAGPKPISRTIQTIEERQAAGSMTLAVERSLPWMPSSFFGGITTGYHSGIHHKGHDNDNNQWVVTARMRLPSWLSNKIWDAIAYRSGHGFTWKLSSWNLRPLNSPIFKAVRQGSVSDLMEILSAGNGSLYDRDDFGYTLLHMAARYHRYDMATFLIKMGHPLFEETSHHKLAVHIPNIDLMYRSTSGVLEFLANYIDHEDFCPDIALLHDQQYGNWGAHIIYYHIWNVPGLAQYVDNGMTTKLRNLLSRYKYNVLGWSFVDPGVLASAMPGIGITFDDLRMSMYYSGPSSILFFLVAYFEFPYRFFWNNNGEPDTDKYQSKRWEWKELARCLVSGMQLDYLVEMVETSFINETVPRHEIHFHLTPLLYAIMSSMRDASRTGRSWRWILRQQLNRARDFLDDLSRAGIDLQEYGREEQALFVNNETVRRRRFTGQVYPYCPHDSPYLVSISYGPTPNDWEFIWDHFTEEFAGEFWEMLEETSLKIPGAWVD